MDPLAQLNMTNMQAVDMTGLLNNAEMARGLGYMGGDMPLPMNLFGTDNALFSQGLNDLGTSGFMPAYAQNQSPFMGLNGGMGMVPGFGGMNGMSGMGGQQQGMQQMMQMIMLMLLMMMQMMQQQCGCGQQQYGMGQQQQFGGFSQFPGISM